MKRVAWGHTAHQLVELGHTLLTLGANVGWAALCFLGSRAGGGAILSVIRAPRGSDVDSSPEWQTQAQSEVPLALGGGTGEAPAPLNVPGTSLLEQCWGLGASPAPLLQAAPGFPARRCDWRHRRCDWQEAGYPRGDPSPRLGDPAAACFLTLQEIGAGSLLWEDSRFPWQPSAAAWLLEGRREASRKSW